MSALSQCRKFQSNIFNKSKCQHCFKPKELHSAEALESSKVARKISKCGYLFVAPDSFDFSNPLQRTRRWQRRFMVLYDDGELTYSVDENVHTVPQGIIDMNLCTDVYDGENATTHQNSIAVITPKSTTYIKANGKEEINRWHDVLIMYPRSRKTKHRRSPTYPASKSETTPTTTTKTQAQPVSDPPSSPPQPTNKTTTTTTTPPTTTTNKKELSNNNNNNKKSSSSSSTNSSSSNSSSTSSEMKRPRYNSSYHPSPGRGHKDGKDGKDSKQHQRAPLNGEAKKTEMEVECSATKDKRVERVEPDSSSSVSSIGSNGLADHGVQRSQPEPSTYRGVRNLKHKHDKLYTEALRKSTSLNDLSTDTSMGSEEVAVEDSRVRSRSRDSASTSRHRPSDLERLREGLSDDADGTAQALLSDRIQQLQHQIQNMQADYEQEIACQKAGHRRELARSKDDLLQLLASVEAKSIQIDEEVIRKRYTKELDRIREMSDRGYAAMEKSHQRVIMEMRRAHKKELDLVRQEKDELLDEETKATQAALDAMRKAHEAEVTKERNKFLDMMAKTYSLSDVESLQRQHEEDLDLIQHEMRELTEQYSIKCLENASLDERLDVQTRALHDSRKRVQDLLARNEELSTKLKHEIEKLNRMVTRKGGASYMGDDEDSSGMSELKVAMRVKQAEVGQLNDEIDGLKEKLQGTVEELEDSMEQYHDLFSDSQSSKRRYENEINELRRRIDEQSVITEEDDDSSSPISTPRAFRQSSERSASPVTSTPRSIRTDYLSSGSDQGTPPRRSALRVTSPEGRRGSQEARNIRKASWRLKQPQRARSSPGLVVTPPATISRQQSVEQPPTHATINLPTTDTSPTRTSRSDRHKTTVGFNVGEQKF